MQPPRPNPYSGKIYTIQRVNGNGANGKTDGNPGPHKHDLDESDKIKKNSVVRWMLKNEKEKKRQPQADQKKTYHTKATGKALETVKKHAAENELKLFGSCFCPFVQRVWISLEYKDIPYQYIEVDPYKKPQSLLEVNPRGLVPALRHGDWGCYESTVLMEYLEDIDVGRPLMPSNPKIRADSRLWSDHINRHLIPGFYRFLQEQDSSKQVQYAEELKTQISKLVDAADKEGPFFLGKEISFVDIQMAPWVIRLNRVLKPYRAWPDPEAGSRWGKWVDAIEKDVHVQATTSTDELYLDSYERYAGECWGSRSV
ncbi:putative glutathione transferase [Neofusicoccum parvum]|uniref:Glutathione transferase n=1 Tax=Neofusicoccum parvum TaxID=310453 RepID=A0ACB5RYG7_9PEZI|nr:putative glutathione transferase [Neofusicoccum parvum]